MTKDDLVTFDLSQLRSFEPWWKLVMSNKAMLPMLYDKYHEKDKDIGGNLIESYFKLDSDSHKNNYNKWVAKPMYGREGIGIKFSFDYSSLKAFLSDIKNGTIVGPSIFQKYTEMPVIQGRRIQMSTWVIGGRFGGMAFRESKTNKFTDGAPFLPHIISDSSKNDVVKFNVPFSARAEEIYKKIYNTKSLTTYDPRMYGFVKN